MNSEKAVAILADAEGRIASLAADAAAGRDYQAAEQLLGVARQLAEASQRLENRPTTSQMTTPSDGSTSVHDVAEDDDDPVFQRSGSDLVKIGKGKQNGPGYEHKAPKLVVDRLLQSIAEKSTTRGEFRTSRIFPLVDEDGRKLPGYQGYLALRWLRQIGLVERVARQRYLMVAGRDPVTSVEIAWRALHERAS